jgi:CheY-like chemotaxis protein
VRAVAFGITRNGFKRHAEERHVGRLGWRGTPQLSEIVHMRPSASTTASRPPGRRMRPHVLVVHGDPDHRRRLAHLLRARYHVFPAAASADAVRLSRLHPPDAAVVDLDDESLTLSSLANDLRSLDCSKFLPIMVIVSMATRQSVLAAIREGATDLLLKDVLDATTLLDRIDRAIDRDPRGVFRKCVMA